MEYIMELGELIGTESPCPPATLRGIFIGPIIMLLSTLRNVFLLPHVCVGFGLLLHLLFVVVYCLCVNTIRPNLILSHLIPPGHLRYTGSTLYQDLYIYLGNVLRRSS